MPAYLFLPQEKARRRHAVPAQTTPIGKGEPAGMGGKTDLQYARGSPSAAVTLAPAIKFQ